jgi:hypothetical protein
MKLVLAVLSLLAALAAIVIVPIAGAHGDESGVVKVGPVALGSEYCPEEDPDPEACTPAQPIGSFNSSNGLRVVFNHPGDCSAIYLELYRDGKKVAETGSVKPGGKDEMKLDWPNDDEEHSLEAVGHGVAGECNNGEYLHAWSGNVEVFYKPPGAKVTISGRVVRRVCADSACKSFDVIDVNGQQVGLDGEGHHFEAITDYDGNYKFRVKRGNYEAHLLGTKSKVDPDHHEVHAEGDVPDQDFTLCKVPENYKGKKRSCDLVEIEGQVRDVYGQPVGTYQVSTNTDQSEVRNGRYSVFAEAGQAAVEVHRQRPTGTGQVDTVSAHGTVVHHDIDMEPMMKPLVAASDPSKLVLEYWNLPARTATGTDRTYTLEVHGTDNANPDRICSLDGKETTSGAGVPPEFSLDEDVLQIKPDPSYEPTFEKTFYNWCESSYLMKLVDSSGKVLIRKVFPGKTDAFKPPPPK